MYIHTQYASEEDDEVGDEVVKPQRKRKLKKAKKTSIYDVYEPSELESGHFTEKDAEFRVTDIPERFQVIRSALSGGVWMGSII